MQSNFSTIKIIRTSTNKPKQQEASEKALKTAYNGKECDRKGVTWKRGTDKREMYNYAIEARY